MDKKLNPLQMVAKELSQHSDMEYDRIESSLLGLVHHLNERALAEIKRDQASDEAAEAAAQYRTFVETIAMFGTQLIAFEDMDEELPRDSN
jgi:hypothetical protein